MIIELVCGGCGLPMTVNVHGKQALDFIKKYDTKVCGKLFCLRCPCGHDLHILGNLSKNISSKKNQNYRLAEI